MNSEQLRITKDLGLTMELINASSCFDINLDTSRNSTVSNEMDIYAPSASGSKATSQLLSQKKNFNMEDSSTVPLQYYTLGKIDKIIEAMNLVIIRPTCANLLVDPGTSVYIVMPSEEASNPKYVLFGKVKNMFGSVRQPMYVVSLTATIKNSISVIANSIVYVENNYRSEDIPHV